MPSLFRLSSSRKESAAYVLSPTSRIAVLTRKEHARVCWSVLNREESKTFSRAERNEKQAAVMACQKIETPEILEANVTERFLFAFRWSDERCVSASLGPSHVKVAATRAGQHMIS